MGKIYLPIAFISNNPDDLLRVLRGMTVLDMNLIKDERLICYVLQDDLGGRFSTSDKPGEYSVGIPDDPHKNVEFTLVDDNEQLT